MKEPNEDITGLNLCRGNVSDADNLTTLLYWLAGYRAAVFGRKCPYALGTGARVSWTRGYDQCQADQRALALESGGR